jgi:predicted ATPase with chaperone activity
MPKGLRKVERDAGVLLTTSCSRAPGAGKSMLARRLTTILPAMTLPEALDTTRLHRVAGRTGDRLAWVTTRPCRAPHHTISDVGLIGGGHVPRPGEVSRAHHGVLFLDARPECRRHVLEVLRQPLEKSITQIQSPARPGPRDAGGAGHTQGDQALTSPEHSNRKN